MASPRIIRPGFGSKDKPLKETDSIMRLDRLHHERAVLTDFYQQGPRKKAVWWHVQSTWYPSLVTTSRSDWVLAFQAAPTILSTPTLSGRLTIIPSYSGPFKRVNVGLHRKWHCELRGVHTLPISFLTRISFDTEFGPLETLFGRRRIYIHTSCREHMAGKGSYPPRRM